MFTVVLTFTEKKIAAERDVCPGKLKIGSKVGVPRGEGGKVCLSRGGRSDVKETGFVRLEGGCCEWSVGKKVGRQLLSRGRSCDGWRRRCFSGIAVAGRGRGRRMEEIAGRGRAGRGRAVEGVLTRRLRSEGVGEEDRLWRRSRQGGAAGWTGMTEVVRLKGKATTEMVWP